MVLREEPGTGHSQPEIETGGDREGEPRISAAYRAR
jgi:hypothetical protein